MKNILLSYWLWTAVLVGFIVIILWDDKLEQAATSYVKHRMVLKNVNFSQVEGGFEHARLYADICDMDDNQNNMNASNVRTIFYKPDQATWTGRLISERAIKNPFEAKFWGDVRGWNTDNERIRSEELRYFFNRKELQTQKPVTIWKDDAILTGLGLRYSTVDKEAQINQQVVIRIWDKSGKTAAADDEMSNVTGLPVAPPLSQLIIPLKIASTTPTSDELSSDTAGTSPEQASKEQQP
ncbi:MAG: LPS export ABC transporter periplasmic protein LptC [Candidatus Riflebacteria bacterium HGW-Riflebacteria-2]|jgi:LPS export ABC transporter protein LptC|nr:MAG: LPS export ABC transporter periplasmic protein LptC [Candidatus Riflebacteria bacterium HGW-Riflebacteria-2]